MLTIEQRYDIQRLQGEKNTLTVLFQHMKEELLLEIMKTDPPEFKKREWIYSQIQNLDELLNLVNSNINTINNEKMKLERKDIKR